MDLIGLVPFFGEGADLLNAASYTLEGDWKNVGYSTASLMPLGGGLVQGSKYANKAIETAGDLSRYKLGPNDLDWRKTDKTYKDALDEAFKKTGFPKDEFVVTKWSHTKDGKTIPVEYVHPSKAEVNMDYRHTNEGPDAPHVGYQLPGKRKQNNGGGKRVHIILDEVPAGRIDKLDE